MSAEPSDDERPSQQRELEVSIVLPTYNESGSLPTLLPRIARTLNDAGLRGEIIVVDDDSPDGTAEVARNMDVGCPVRVLRRTEERGLATAVIAGFGMAHGEVCIVMDADGSHPVETVPQMVRIIQKDQAEIVVGSRHVEGGGSQDWPLFSQLKSRFAATLALGLTSLTDPTTGFMAIRKTVLDRLSLDPVGWKIVLETVVKAHPARLAEVPIVFTDRAAGESKQSLKVLGEYFSHLYKLYKFRFPGFVEFLKFCVVGMLGVFVDLSVVSALRLGFGIDTRLCQVGGFSAAVTFNYAVNRRFSFEGARNTPVLYSYVTYVGTNLIGLALRILVIQALMGLTTWDRDHGYGYLLLSTLGIVLATLVNFVGVKYFAFAPERLAPARTQTSPVPVASEPRSAPYQVVALVLLACAVLAAGYWGAADPRTHDEAVNLTMAAHIEAGIEGLIHPSTDPSPRAPWAEQSLPRLGNTPVYPALLAAFSRALGASGLGLLTALVLAACLLGTAYAVRAVHAKATWAAVAMFGSAPWVVAAFSLREFEPLVTALGILGFAALTRLERRRGAAALSVLGGLALGLAFATKMWLALPVFAATFSYLVARHYELPKSERGALRVHALMAFVATLAGAVSHLAFVALTAPADVSLWLDRVYFAIFTGAGVTGGKLSGGHGASAWAYAWWLLRDHGALLVVYAYGLPAATRRLDGLRTAFLFAVSGALLALVPLSVPAFKEPLYLTPALPFLYALGGSCLVAAQAAPARHHRVQEAAARAALAIAAAIASALVVSAWLSSESNPTHTAVRVGAVLAWALPPFVSLRSPSRTWPMAAAACVSLALTLVLLWGPPAEMPHGDRSARAAREDRAIGRVSRL